MNGRACGHHNAEERTPGSQSTFSSHSHRFFFHLFFRCVDVREWYYSQRPTPSRGHTDVCRPQLSLPFARACLRAAKDAPCPGVDHQGRRHSHLLARSCALASGTCTARTVTTKSRQRSARFSTPRRGWGRRGAGERQHSCHQNIFVMRFYLFYNLLLPPSPPPTCSRFRFFRDAPHPETARTRTRSRRARAQNKYRPPTTPSAQSSPTRASSRCLTTACKLLLPSPAPPTSSPPPWSSSTSPASSRWGRRKTRPVEVVARKGSTVESAPPPKAKNPAPPMLE